MVTKFNGGGEVETGSRGIRTKVSRDQIYAFTSERFDNLSEEFAEASVHLIIIGYILMIIYCGIAFFYFDWVNSHASVGLVSAIMVTTSKKKGLIVFPNFQVLSFITHHVFYVIIFLI